MRRAKPIPAVMAALIAAGVNGAAFAATNGKGEDAREIEALQSAKVTAEQAIAAAEQKTDGHALKVGLEDENGRVLYDVKTVIQDKVFDVYVDPNSGQIVRSEEEGLIDRMLDREDKAQLAQLMKSPTTLATAIAAAEQQTGGKVIEAAYDDENGRGIFEAEVLKDNARQEVKVEGATGKVMSVSAAKHGEKGEH